MKRLNRELADLSKEDLGAMTLAPNDANLFEWKATIPGPAGSPYEGGLFQVDINLPDDYPFSAPKATFVTKIYHMNISERGQVCVDLLKHNWSPALSLFKVLLSLSSLLTDPNPKDPLVPNIATQYNRQRAQHDSTARQWTQLYAVPASQIQGSSSSAGPVSTSTAATNTTSQRPTNSRVGSAIQRRLRMAVASLAVAGSSNAPNATTNGFAGHHHPHHLPTQARTRTRTSANGSGASSSHNTPTPITISDDETPIRTTTARKRKSDSTHLEGQGGSSSSGSQAQKRRLNRDSSGSVIVIDD